MKYFILGGFALFITMIISKVVVALELVNLNEIKEEKIALKVDESNERKLKEIGKQTYLVFCSSCHGKDGKGNDEKAQDHTKRIAKKSVLDIINNGSNNFTSLYPSGMPAALVGEEDARELAVYIANGMKEKKPKAWVVCASCHNEDGEGIVFIAPNIKTYSDELVKTVLTNGKKGVIGTMPNFSGRLSEIQMQALATYIRTLSAKMRDTNMKERE